MAEQEMVKVGRLKFNYDRITPQDLREGLKRLGLLNSEFARISGFGPKRVDDWTDDNAREDIPHTAHVMLEIFEEVPGAIAVAKKLADEWSEKDFRTVEVPATHTLAVSKKARGA